MVQPFDYRINVTQPVNGVLTGIQTAMQMAQAKSATDANKAQQALFEQQRIGAEQAAIEQRAMREKMRSVAANPTTEAIASLMVEYPQLSEGFKRGFEAVGEDRKKTLVQESSQAYAAVLNDKPEIAVDMLNQNAQAYRDKGDTKTAEMYERTAKLIEISPQNAKTGLGMMVATAMGPDKFESTFKGLEDQRRARMTEGDVARNTKATADKAESDAAIAAAKAKYAESDAALEVTKKGWDITKIQEDIKINKLNAQIAAAQVSASREMNQLKRDELGLKIEDMKSARDKATREKVAEVESARFNVDNMMNTIQRIKQNKALSAVIGPIEGSDFYPQTAVGMQAFTASADDRADAIALIETLGSQAFLSQIPNIKGMGQLSNVEGDKLQAAFQNLKRKQSEKQFNASLDEASRLLNKARENIATRYGVPNTKPDVPAAPGARPPLSSFER